MDSHHSTKGVTIDYADMDHIVYICVYVYDRVTSTLILILKEISTCRL